MFSSGFYKANLNGIGPKIHENKEMWFNRFLFLISYSASDLQELNQGIRREVKRLTEHWTVLLAQAEDWHRQLDEMLPVSRNDFNEALKVDYSFVFIFTESSCISKKSRGCDTTSV